MFIDTHCHLDFPEFDNDRDQVIKDAKAQCINYIVNVGSSIRSSLNSVELAKKYDFVYAAVGIHPHEADRVDKNTDKSIRELAKNNKVIAIGEIGLDYYRNFSKKENQKPLFISLIRVAKDLNLPIIIHCREAWHDTLDILKQNLPVSAVIHCFSGNDDILMDCLSLGFYISYTCNITYKKTQNLRDLVKLTDNDRLLLETDCPYLSPEGMRGKRNVPVNVKTLAQAVAAIKHITTEEVAKITLDNAKRFFNLK